MTARDYLLHLRSRQRDLVGYNSTSQVLKKPDAWRRLVSTELDSFIESEMQVRASELGSYEDVLLEQLQTMIVATSPQCEHEEFAIGELFLSYPQAKILRVPGTRNSYVIALHSHLSLLLRYVVVLGTTRLRLDNGLSAVMDRESLYDWFANVISFFFLKRGTMPPCPEPADENDLIMTELTWVSAILWVLCHEYGHYLAGHLSKPSDFRTIQMIEEDVQIYEGPGDIASKWQREYTADVSGYDMLLEAVQHERFFYHEPGDISSQDRRYLASQGVDAVLALLGLVDRRYVLFGKDRYDFGTHPPAHLRLAHLKAKRAGLFTKGSPFTSIVTGYFDTLYKGLAGTLDVREP